MIDYEQLKKSINKSLKQDLVSLGTDLLVSEVKGFIPTGWTLLDECIGGGLPLGRTVELFGQESTGKSTLMYQTMANCQNMGGVVILFDPETTFPAEFAASLGVDVGKVLIMDPMVALEHVFQHIIKLSDLIRKDSPDVPILIVWDTLAATPSQNEMKAFEEGDDFNRGANMYRAQVIKSGMRSCTVKLAQTAACLVVVNHVFDEIAKGGGNYGPPSSTPGGRGVKYHASVRINLWTGASIKEGDIEVGRKVTAKIEKNKLGTPKTKLYSFFYYGVGFNDEQAVWEYCIENDLITQKGAWFYFQDPENGDEIKMHGKAGFGDLVANKPQIYEHIKEKAKEHVRNSYIVGED